MKEVWTPVRDYPAYEVSNLGRVRSLDRYVTQISRWGTPMQSFQKGRILKPNFGKGGYAYVGLADGGVVKTLKIHRLVAAAFCEQEEGCNVVNHLDGDVTNNTPENLEWTTNQGNVQHAFDTGLATPTERKLSKEQEAAVIVDLRNGMTRQKVADKHGISSSLASLYAVRNNIPVFVESKARTEAIIADLKEGKLRRYQIAEKHGVSRGYISRVAAENGFAKLVNQSS